MNFLKARLTLVVVLLVAVSFGIGYGFGAWGFQVSLSSPPNVTISRETPPDKNLDFSLFWDVWDRINSRYWDKDSIVPANLVYGAIRGMVAAVGDPYTVFLTPAENRQVNQDLQGSFDGVGIEIGFKENQLVIISPLPDSPAERAGFMAGDKIIAIRDSVKGVDRQTSGISLPDAVGLIRGPRGTKVTLVVSRDGLDDLIEKEIVRGSISVSSVTSKLSDDGSVEIVKINKFGLETSNEWKKVVAEVLANKGIKGIVIDVRNNPGGYFQAAVDIASDLLPSGKTIVTEEGGDGNKLPYKTSLKGSLSSVPVVVLVNSGSASASEILAAALSQNGRAKLVGETTFGKGTVQEPEDLMGGAGLHVTISRWLTPNDNWVNESGLTPDKEVNDDAETEADEQLNAALAVLSEN